MTTKIFCNKCKKEITEFPYPGNPDGYDGFVLTATPLCSDRGEHLGEFPADKLSLGHLCRDCIPEFLENYKPIKEAKK